MAQLEKLLRNPDSTKNIDAAIEEVVTGWLPQALTGQTRENIPVNMLFAPVSATAEERNKLAEDIRKYLRLNWQKSEIARELNPVRARGGRSRRRGLFGT